MKLQSNHKPTILQVLPALNSGGVERGAIEIAKALVTNDINSIVASSGGKLMPQLLESGSVHITLPLDSKNPLVLLNNINKIKSIIKEYKIDLIHARSRAPAWSAYCAAKAMNIPFITTYHGTYGHNIFKKFYNEIMVKGEKVIAVSEFIKQLITQYYPESVEKIEVIHRGIDPAYFNPERITEQMREIMLAKVGIIKDKLNNKPIILLPARISKWKGHEVFINALNLIEPRNFIAIIIGENNHPSLLEHLNNLVIQYGLTNNVIFANSITDMPSLYAISDIVVIPSTKGEAFGRISIEAQAMQKIVIASDVGGSIETIIEEETGFLFKNNDPIDLAEKIAHVCTMDFNSKASLGIKARQNVIDNFNLNKMQNQTINIYKKILQR